MMCAVEVAVLAYSMMLVYGVPHTTIHNRHTIPTPHTSQ